MATGPFEVGRVYRRRELHEQYGGQRQGGIATPVGHPFIFCVTGSSGESYGYADEWDDAGVLRYYGEGQTGDMTWDHGNKAVRDHVAEGEALYVFERARPKYLRFVGEFVCGGFEYDDDALDRDGNVRRAIVFLLTPLSDVDDPEPDGGEAPAPSLNDLRDDALDDPGETTPKQSKRSVYRRSRALRRYVRARAAGQCEGCGSPAPFVDRTGDPYLEPHHTRRVSDGGPDHPRWVIALCPSCHARVHYGGDGETYNIELMTTLGSIEPGEPTGQGT